MEKIKAPEGLKRETIAVLERRKNISSARKIPTFALTLIAVLTLSFTALGMDLFSGLSGDELSLSAEYRENGIVDVKIKNLSQKELKLSNKVRLMRWQDSLEIGTYSVNIPPIKSNEEILINVNIPDYKEKKLLEPLESGDHYYFVFTNNNFLHGYDYMASFNFTSQREPVIKQEQQPQKEIIIKEQADSQQVLNIKENFKIAAPLDHMEITAPYGFNETSQNFNEGISLKCKEGDDVRAISDGVVTETGKSGSYGIYVVIDHGKGFKSRCCHLSANIKEKGEKVAAGEIIARSGRTGKAVGDCLELITSLDGKIFDPTLILE